MGTGIDHDWPSKWQLRRIVIVNERFNMRTPSNENSTRVVTTFYK